MSFILHRILLVATFYKQHKKSSVCNLSSRLVFNVFFFTFAHEILNIKVNMTRRINSLLALFALTFFSFVLPVQAQEVEKYELWVAGEKITSKNRENFTDDALIEGKVSYDPAKKELTLDNAVISTNSYRGIRSAINGLKITVKGKCSITAGSSSTIELSRATTIMGASLADELTLICNDTFYGGTSTLNISNVCTIRTCTIITESTSSSFGDNFYSGSGRSVIVEDARIRISGNNKKPSFGNVAVLRLRGCVITKPKGAKFDISKECIVAIIDGKEQVVKGDIVIEPMSVVPVTGLTLTPTEATLKEEEEITLTAKVQPDNATEQGIAWSSSDPTIATVTQAGKVKALQKGKCQIIAKSLEEGSDKQAVCNITVKGKADEYIAVTSVVVAPEKATINEGDKLTLSGKVLPANATEQGLRWSTTDAKVAIVSQAGGVVAVQAGKCKIVATSVDKGDKYAECEVTVIPKGAKPNPGTEVADAPFASLVITPNPFAYQLCITFKVLHNTKYELLNASGITVRKGLLENEVTVIDTEVLPAGVYFLRLVTEEGKEKTERIVKL